MASKKRKKKKKTPKSRIQYTVLWALIVLSMVVLFVWAYSFLVGTRTAPLLYEEFQSRSTHFHEEMRKIENGVYEALYEEGIGETDILFVKVDPRYSGNHAWDFAELLIRLPKRDKLKSLEKKFYAELYPLKPAVTIRSEEVSSREIVCHIFLSDHYTHRIRLRYEGTGKTLISRLPTVAIIIDDLGYDARTAFQFLELGLPLDLSILPLAPQTNAIVNRARARGCEIMLHLPMEPKDYPSLNPGPGALLTSMEETEIREVMGDHFKSMPWVRGVNNHMGSLFTERPEKMAVVLDELRKRGLFFVDSKTTPKSTGFRLAKKMGIPVARRSIFLDNDLSHRAIGFQMERLLGIARHAGFAVGIGHPNEATAIVLKKYLHRLKGEVRVVPVSDITS